MDLGAMLGAFIAWPLLALAPAAAFGLLYARSRRRVVLVAALAWLGYCAYELGMKLRILCTGECNIRVDLLLLYPVLLLLSAAAVVAHRRAVRRRGPA